MDDKSKKHVTSYIEIESGVENTQEEKYTAAPQAEFIRTDDKLLQVKFNYGTTANIPIYYAIFISLIICVPVTIIMAFLEFSFLIAGLFVDLIMILLLFVPAIILRQIKLNKSFEFIFDKKLDKFTKSKIKADDARELKSESLLSQIRQVEIKSTRYKQTTRHWIFLRLNDESKVKFFFISYNNPSQIVEYTLWLCKFLGIDLNLTTSLARKYFSGII